MNAAHDHAPPTLGTLGFLVRLLRWRKAILLNTGIVAVLAVGISLLLPNWYESWTSLLPPEEESFSLGSLATDVGSAVAAASQGRLALTGRMSLPMWASPSDLLAGILRSRRLREDVIRSHDLLAVYECETMDEAVEEFRDRSKVRVGAEGIVHLAILDREPQRATAIAQTCLRILDEIQRGARHGSAADVRRFVEERLAATRGQLVAAEESLRVFEERHGLLQPEDQARAMVETIARVEAERLLAEVERNALAAQVGEEHPEVTAYDLRLRSLAAARASLEGRLPSGETGAPTGAGAGRDRAGEGRGASIALGRMPELSLAYTRLYRDLQIQEALFEMLTQAREQYRILEVRDTPTIQVLSSPTTPEKKVKPRRAVICVVATLLAFLLSAGVAAMLEKLALLAESDPRRYAQVETLLAGVGLGFLRRRRGTHPERR